MVASDLPKIELTDPCAGIREELLANARRYTKAVGEKYKSLIDGARHPLEIDRLCRACREECMAITEIYARTLAKLPPPPIYIRADQIAA